MATDQSHWDALNHLISYIRFTARLSLPIKATGDAQDCLKTFTDANWGGKGWRLVHGFISTAWGAPVSWGSKRQSCVARSTCQAEYMALLFASKDACFLQSLLSGFFSVRPPIILSDNKAAVYIARDCGTRKEHHHIDREFHIINELLYDEKVRLEWISSPTNIFTKALGWRKVSEFLSQTGLRPTSHTLASIRGKVCASCGDPTPPVIVCLSPDSQD
ncbi:hypothetical protein MJO28_016514 [Puccinia striiformis f. sp. tritici]|uniref:Uncharacterized protein n=1 Tax=Puccinia striiformis f. sp. tritici TaxID=168172 RepID=A0ACC0DN92_9BASI|nr:hypothetical protein MJO28_016514 [Puccinia striiformis f. sp. tritici]